MFDAFHDVTPGPGYRYLPVDTDTDAAEADAASDEGRPLLRFDRLRDQADRTGTPAPLRQRKSVSRPLASDLFLIASGRLA
ncbi:hypothetical protein OIE67_15220 [Nonomuraea fuscirosea]|uniref:hypothetical protein n=1 Tax=Nonomuraea fuscirosea TaxID=1291556 RepID=UPI002DDC4152|nr:hypothetical protein [Nonomuraea fuscirosea]WSA55904.1 hypothetical protein OIE67_15220 [Nonomuraea fuscirosea]